MSPGDISARVRQLDTSSSRTEEEVWSHLRPLGSLVVPYLSEAYGTFRTWQGRSSLVYHSIRYARTSDDAFNLGLRALQDKATVVRYRACSLLAYSLRRDAFPLLEQATQHVDEKTVADAIAALDAIRQQNHHLFVDRGRGGRTFWVVNESDRGNA